MTSLLRTAASRYWGVLLILVIWQAWVSVGDLNSIVMPRPAAVAAELIGHPSIYLTNGVQTLALAAGGLVVGMTLGSLIAIACWFSRLVTGMLVPLAMIFSSVPVVALIPIIARLLGLDTEPPS